MGNLVSFVYSLQEFFCNPKWQPGMLVCYREIFLSWGHLKVVTISSKPRQLGTINQIEEDLDSNYDNIGWQLQSDLDS